MNALLSSGTFSPSLENAHLPHWRLLTAMKLAMESQGEVAPEHEDVWIRDTAQLHCEGHSTTDFQPTERQKHILYAIGINKMDGLVPRVLELLISCYPSREMVCQKFRIERDTLEAYQAVFCDLSTHERQQAWSRAQMIRGRDGPLGRLANSLGLLRIRGYPCQDRFIETLCRLQGPTLADAMPARDTPAFAQALLVRVEIAQALLPNNKKNSRLMQEFNRLLTASMPSVTLSPETIEVGLTILQKAKITRQVRAELSRLRAFWRMDRPVSPGEFS